MPELSIFISWSGDPSKAIAIALQDFLQEVCDLFKPFVSDQSIASGERGLQRLAAELTQTNLGILVITPENQDSVWINFEAGALSKQVDDPQSRVIPLLVNMQGSDLGNTALSQFQYRRLIRSDMERIAKEFAKLAGVTEHTVIKRFEADWDEFEGKCQAAISQARHPSRAGRRSTEDMLAEILELVRSLSRQSDTSELLTRLIHEQSDQEAILREREAISRRAMRQGRPSVPSRLNEATRVARRVLTEAGLEDIQYTLDANTSGLIEIDFYDPVPLETQARLHQKLSDIVGQSAFQLSFVK